MKYKTLINILLSSANGYMMPKTTEEKINFENHTILNPLILGKEERYRMCSENSNQNILRFKMRDPNMCGKTDFSDKIGSLASKNMY